MDIFKRRRGSAVLGITCTMAMLPSAVHAQLYSRTETITYRNDTTGWVLGQVEAQSSNGVLPAAPAQMVETQRTDYNTQGLPWKIYKFGKLQRTLTYDTKGTVASIADGANKTTYLSNWSRGVPQSVQFADGTTRSASVNSDGTIGWTADEIGYKTCYTYDAMGRMTSVTQPQDVVPQSGTIGGCDTTQTKWAVTTSSFTRVSVSEYGLPAGHWKQVTQTGNARSITYVDAYWRPVVIEAFDATNASTTAATRSITVNNYDLSGHKTYTSYPLASLTTYTASNPGVWTTYDALDRVTSVGQDSELGRLTTTTQHGSDASGPWTVVTNPRQQSTWTWFQAFDTPSYDAPVQILQPENALTEINRTGIGAPTWIRRRNVDNTVSALRRYVYDGYQQLCKTIEPESGSTLIRYDAAGNVDLTASGLASPDLTCNYAEAAGSAVTRQYDARNRLLYLRFPDARGDQDWTYTPDGLPETVVTRNDASVSTVTNSYVYNSRRLLTGETQANGTYTWSVGYGYNALGHRESLVYPAGLSLSYGLNALGQVTSITGASRTWASAASYYPNGSLKQFTYGNNVVHTMQQNVRQLPSRVTSNNNVLDYGYSYDENGNVVGITDYTRGSTYNRTMTYDNLDRLLTAQSGSFGGTDGTHRYTYDALDNITSWKQAGVKDYATYYYNPTNNRLENILNSNGSSVIGFGYDPQGNLSAKNGQGYNFDYGNRLRSVPTKESYRYDAFGRRIQATSAVNVPIFSLYSQEGQILWERDERSGKRTHNIYLAGSLIATRSRPLGAETETVLYRHTDALGSPTAVTGLAREITDRTAWEPYGAAIGKPTYQGIGYTGHVQDSQTGLTYMQQRYYDATVGRFLSTDPISAHEKPGQNFNRYLYANGNPYRFVDPDGRETIVVVNSNGPLFIGAHVGVVIQRDGSTQVYDPGGDYRSDLRGSGGLVEEQASLSDYIAYQRADGPWVNVSRFDTTPDQEQQILSNIEEVGDPGPGFCAAAVSSVLAGVGPFEDIDHSFTPNGVQAEMKEITGSTSTDSIRQPDIVEHHP